ncbi:Kinase-like protein [Mycena venus]|uniref:Kinase-like protein n=1 Tax=Mycena venus TaxID=2733690 RepID=A0A8H6Z412_9AGAR|nr:Kinase-like protein [Mycena venus]
MDHSAEAMEFFDFSLFHRDDAHSQPTGFSESPAQQMWSPVCFSSPSASTEYWSTDPTPFTTPYGPANDSFGEPSHLPDTSQESLFSQPMLGSRKINVVFKYPDPSMWCEQLTWSEPSPLEVCINPRSTPSGSDDCVIDYNACPEPIPESPSELVDSLSQDKVDENLREMTCGPKVENHFWPLRYRIRSGELYLYENTINTLILHARMEFQPIMLSKLTNELVAHRAESSPRLTSLLAESRSLYERLCQIASELRATDLQSFKDAIWQDRVIIILILYEILTSKMDLDEVMRLRGTRAQFMLDLMQDVISKVVNVMRTHIDLVHLLTGRAPHIPWGARRIFLSKLMDLKLLRNVDRPLARLDIRRVIVQLSEISNLLPSSLTIRGVEDRSTTPLAGGNFGDIFQAQYQGKVVALKRLRLFQAESDESVRIRQKFRREALIWKNLDHDYVLPFLGVDSETFPGFLCIVSPWMSKGALVNTNGGPPEEFIPVLIYEIAVGLKYLHFENIVHGDLRGANILLDDEGHARLADFGLAAFADGPMAPTNRGGSLRWMAPELLDPASCGFKVFQRTFASDIYSFACVCLELYTGKPPFSDLFEGAVLLKVIMGSRPEFPSAMPAWCQQLTAKCWSQSPFDRPGTDTIIESIVRDVALAHCKKWSPSKDPRTKNLGFQTIQLGCELPHPILILDKYSVSFDIFMFL